MRVLHVIPSLASRTGGPAASVVESSLALQRCGVDVTIFATDMVTSRSFLTNTGAKSRNIANSGQNLRFSVAIPLHNKKSTVARAIRSAL